MRISDWSSDVCSSDLQRPGEDDRHRHAYSWCATIVPSGNDHAGRCAVGWAQQSWGCNTSTPPELQWRPKSGRPNWSRRRGRESEYYRRLQPESAGFGSRCDVDPAQRRSEEHTSELQSLMRISYAVF